MIDALSAGLPVIATNWNYNFDVLENSKTGYMVEINNPSEVADKIIEIYKNQKQLVKMKFNCVKQANKYKPEEAMKKFVAEIS